MAKFWKRAVKEITVILDLDRFADVVGGVPEIGNIIPRNVIIDVVPENCNYVVSKLTADPATVVATVYER